MSQFDESSPSQPRLRAGDADRQQAVEELARAWREGRINQDEFQQRNQQVLTATYVDQIDPLVADVAGPSSYTAPATTAASQAPLAIRDSWQSERDDNLTAVRYAPEGVRGSAISVGVMGGADKAGQWVVAASHVSIGFMGGTRLDLRDALFTSAETTIVCIAVMGGVEVIVPPEMDVQVSGIGFMGGFGWEKLHEASPTVAPTPENPRVRIHGLGLMGGVEVTRRERGEQLPS